MLLEERPWLGRPFLKKNALVFLQKKNLINLIEVTYMSRKPNRIVPQIPKATERTSTEFVAK